ncbi:Crp/Fnr family transcriptional regulator [bacterium]|nr:Crp/Fnr family transcriptional regulator [bacterium]
MKKYLDFLKTTQLFAAMQEEEMSSLLNCLSFRREQYKTGEIIIHEGDEVHSIGLVYKGSVHIIQDDFWGNRSIIARITPGLLFGEVFAFSKNRPSNVDVIAMENCEILFFDFEKVITVCGANCQFHNRLIRNLLNIVADKNFIINTKLRCLSQRTTREKVLSYLSDEYKKSGKSEFNIPFNRQQLADYLLVERSALSNELSKMQNEGIIEFHKSLFKLKSSR